MYELLLRQKKLSVRTTVAANFVVVQPATFKWEETEAEAFRQDIQESYKQIVHWRHNLFKVPSGQASESFVRELTRMFKSYAEESALLLLIHQARKHLLPVA